MALENGGQASASNIWFHSALQAHWTNDAGEHELDAICRRLSARGLSQPRRGGEVSESLTPLLDLGIEMDLS